MYNLPEGSGLSIRCQVAFFTYELCSKSKMFHTQYCQLPLLTMLHHLFSVCEVVVKELEKGINDVDPKKVIDLGGRLEADGSRKVIKVSFIYFCR